MARRKQQPVSPDPPESSPPPTRRSKRVNAGQGGYTDQLERVAAVIETPHQPPRQQVNLPDDDPVNPMAPAPRRPRKRASRRSGKGSEDSKASATPPSHLVPMVKPVSEPAAPDGRFGYQIPPPAPKFVGSQSVATFEQDRIARKVAQSPMASAKGKTSRASTQVLSGPGSYPTNGVHPPRSSAPRSKTPIRSSRRIPNVSPAPYVEDQQPQSRKSATERTHRAQLAPSIDWSSPLSEMEGESQQNQLWDIEEEREQDEGVEEDEEHRKDEMSEEADDDREEEEGDRTRFSDMYEDKCATRSDDASNDGMVVDVTPVDAAGPQGKQYDHSRQHSVPPSLPHKHQQADDRRPLDTQSQQSSNRQSRRFDFNAESDDRSSHAGCTNGQPRLPVQSRVPAQAHRPARAQGPRSSSQSCVPPQLRAQAQDLHVPSQSRGQAQDSRAPSQPHAEAQDVQSRGQARDSRAPSRPHAVPSQFRAQAQSRVPSQSRVQTQVPQGQVRQQALLSPPPTRSNSVLGDPVNETEKSCRHGEERIGVEYDLLDRHHSTNRRRQPPSPTYLDSIRSNGAGNYKKARKDPSNEDSGSVNPQPPSGKTKDTTGDSIQNQSKNRKGRWSVNPKGTKPVSPTTLAFYPPLWQKLLDCAKARMRLYVTVENPFPVLATAIEGACQECLFEVLAYYEENDLEVEAGTSYASNHSVYLQSIDYYPQYKRDMARLLYNDISTYRCEIKKLVMQIVPIHYQLHPSTTARTDAERYRSILPSFVSNY
ncbi:hypothetical protein JVT61DRAFT_14585 [Boletus reticuloceps]|uniref:DUF6532 domain-containing protein n=1 Tax=Boletus reticuloceps TaxID=495285 RepID=A0A8I3ACT4_9AGAM|nr:hypothetical protein JVT61DRAFT_14585 [Boletus reticuloceps]